MIDKLDESLQTMLVSVNLRGPGYDRTVHKLATEDNFMEIADFLLKQLQYQSKVGIIQVSIKVRRLNSKERLVFELAT